MSASSTASTTPPSFQIDGKSYRMRGHRARLQQLRAGLNQPSKGG